MNMNLHQPSHHEPHSGGISRDKLLSQLGLRFWPLPWSRARAEDTDPAAIPTRGSSQVKVGRHGDPRAHSLGHRGRQLVLSRQLEPQGGT